MQMFYKTSTKESFWKQSKTIYQNRQISRNQTWYVELHKSKKLVQPLAMERIPSIYL